MEFPLKGYTPGEPSLLTVPSRWKGERLLLKLPAALMREARIIVPYVEKVTSKEVILSSRPSFGACDISPGECSQGGVCGVLDLGHAPMPSIYGFSRCRFLSVPLQLEADVGRFCRFLKGLPAEPPGRLGLLTTAQHRGLLGPAAEVLKAKGFDVRVKRGSKRVFFPGHVLGCDISSARAVAGEVDAFLYIGTGEFHPRGVALSTGIKVYTLDPLGGRWGEVEEGLRERFIRRRYAAMVEARRLMDEGETVGIYISELLGQRRPEVAEGLRRELEGRGVEVVLLQSETLSPLQVKDLSIRVMVNTACPRITVDDFPLYRDAGTILLTPWEMKALLQNLPPEDYVLDELS